MPDEELFSKVDTCMLKKELLGVSNVFQKAFAIKAMILNYNIAFLNKIFNNSFFIRVKRDPLTAIESVLEARERQYGDKNEWFSFRIPEYNLLKNYCDPLKEAAGQIIYTNLAIDRGLKSVNINRKMIVQYNTYLLLSLINTN